MSALTCRIKGQSTVLDLVKGRNSFKYLLGRAPIKNKAIMWAVGTQTTHDIQVIAIGKTGYGKSTTLNRLVGHNLFETNDVDSCTSEMQSVEFDFECDYLANFSVADMPGVGESLQKDAEYVALYKKAVSMSHVILYFLRADQRDLAVDIDVFRKVIKARSVIDRTIVVMNCIDKIEPLSDDRRSVSEIQWKNINQKVDVISRELQVSRSDIVPVSASTGLGLDALELAIQGRIMPLLNIT